MRWAEEHTLIWAAHQLEQWSQRLAKERGEEPPQPDELLAKVRNAVEHVDDADFEKGNAVPRATREQPIVAPCQVGALRSALGERSRC